MVITIYSTLSDKCSISQFQYFGNELLISFFLSVLLHSVIYNPWLENMREPFGTLQLLLSFQVFRMSIHQHLRFSKCNGDKRRSVKDFVFM